MRLKKILSLLVVVSMLFTMFTTVSFAADEATLVVSSVSAKRGETVLVEVTAANNPGIAVADIKVNYDNTALKLISVEDGGIWGEELHSDKLTANPYTLFWNNSTAEESITANGVIATLEFEVLEGADFRDYEITLAQDILDADTDAVEFELVAGKVTVENPVAALTVSSASAKAGETADVTITSENNPGIAVAKVMVDYDSAALKLSEVADGNIWGEDLHSDKLTADPYTLFWNNSTAEESITADGVIATLKFEVLAGAEAKDYDITISYEILDAEGDAVTFETAAGKVTVEETVPENATLTVASATAKAGETADVAISAANNPGIAVAKVMVDYDSAALKLSEVADGNIWGEDLHSDKLTADPYTLFWNNSTEEDAITADGVIATLKFEVLAGAEAKDYDVTITYEILDAEGNAVTFDTVAGKVTVEEGGVVEPETFEVVFVADGVTVDTKTVTVGESLAVADFPAVPAKQYYDGAWDVNEAITEAKTVNAVYTRRTFVVTFVADGNTVATETVNEGEALAVADFPAVPAKDGFTGAWDVNTDITAATTVTAVYTEIPVEPEAPEIISITATAASKNAGVKVTVDAKGSDITSVTFKLDDEAPVEAVLENGVYTYLFTGLTRNTEYTVVVAATNDIGTTTETYTFKTKSGATGGGGGGSTKLPVLDGGDKEEPDQPVEPDKPVDPDQPIDPDQPVDPTPGTSDCHTFTDIDGRWSETEICNAAKAGLVSGRNEKIFDPTANLTRSEAFKLQQNFDAVAGLDLALVNDVDVDTTGWAYESDLWAAQTGITIGIGTDENGVILVNGDANITRQDLMLATSRLVKMALGNVTIEGDAVAFADADEIAPYAVEGVQLLAKLGIVKGSDGKVNPRANITREEATAIFNRTYAIISVLVAK